MRLRRSFAHALLVVAVLALASPLAAGDYKESYKQGVRAIEKKEWQAAIRHFESAIGERPQAGGSKVLISGMFSEEYTPYYHLGWAYDRVGEAAKAREMLEQSVRQNVIKSGSKQGKVRTQMLARLKPKEAEVPEAVVADARGKVRSATDLEDELQKKMKGFAAFATENPQLNDELGEMFAERARIATRLAAAKTESEFKSVGQDAGALVTRLETASGDVAKGLETNSARVLEAAKEHTSRSIYQAKKLGEGLSSQQSQTLAKDRNWAKTGSTLSKATDLFEQGTKSGNLTQIEEAGRLAEQADGERKKLIALVDTDLKRKRDRQEEQARLIRRANQEIDQLKEESRGLLDQAQEVDSTSSLRASLEGVLRERPANDAPLRNLTNYVTRLRSENTRLGSAMSSDLLAREQQAESAMDDARGALARAAKVESPNPELQLGIDVVNRLLAEQPPGEEYLARLRQAVDDLDIAMVPSSIDQRLAKAYQAYTKCDYEGVETALADATFDKAWLNVQANLFRAAALFARYVHGGKEDDSLRQQARLAVQECLRLDADYSPRETVFSPPFLAFYGES
jgi:hypothetical protein